MNSKMKKTVLALAVVLSIAAGLTIYLELFLPQCDMSRSEVVRSNAGDYFALVEWRQCKDQSRSLGQVLVGSGTTTEKIVAVEFRPPEDEVKLEWSKGELVVTLSATTTVKQYGPYQEWPSVRSVRE
jgi:hypothetical protein